MRTLVALVALAAGAAALLSGCSTGPDPALQGQASRPLPQDWILIAPPDNTLTVAFLDTFEFLPDGKDRFPATTDGMSEPDRRSLQDLFKQVQAAPSAQARLQILTDLSAVTEAPLEQWRQVRGFRSADECESTRAELVKVTSEQTRNVGAYAGMPREEFQWPLLAKSFQWSRCVPNDVAAARRQT
jgi:hypothetical protein